MKVSRGRRRLCGVPPSLLPRGEATGQHVPVDRERAGEPGEPLAALPISSTPNHHSYRWLDISPGLGEALAPAMDPGWEMRQHLRLRDVVGMLQRAGEP